MLFRSDDRPKVSPGVKFADAEIIGAPMVVVVGRGLAEGVVELRLRRAADAAVAGLDAPDTLVVQVPVADAARRTADVVRRLLAG